MGGVIAAYLPPPPPGSGPHSEWADTNALRVLLKDAGATLEHANVERLMLSFDDAPAHRGDGPDELLVFWSIVL